MIAWATVPFDVPVADPFADVPTPAVKGARVFVGLPSYGHVVGDCLEPLQMAASPEDESVEAFMVKPLHQSLLAYCFNGLVCMALNSQAEARWTHFCLHHSDIQAQPGFLNVMVKEMARVGADVLSVVVPIKDHRGLTSTGLRGQSSGCTRRLTIREVLKLPVTFDAAMAGAKGDEILAVNTGLLMFRLDQPWVREADPDGCLPYAFTIRDFIKVQDNGTVAPIVWPEDWLFSAWAAQKGLKVFATRKVAVEHHGVWKWGNQTAWGEWETERGGT